MGKLNHSSPEITKKLTILSRPLSTQPVYLKTNTPAARATSKGLENGHSQVDVDEAILKRGEVRYGNYFQERRELAPNAQGLAAFL